MVFWELLCFQPFISLEMYDANLERAQKNRARLLISCDELSVSLVGERGFIDFPLI